MSTAIAFTPKNGLRSSEVERVIAEIAAKRKSVSLADFVKGNDVDSQGGATLQNGYQQSVWVYSCITILAENVSGIPFRFVSGTEDDETVLQKGDVIDLFKRPHPQLTRFQFWELVVTWLCLRGEFFIVPVRAEGRGRKIEALLVLPPDSFQHVVEGNTLVGWRYTGFGPDTPLASQVFLPEEIIHDRLPNPFHFWRGMSPLSVAWLSAQTDYASAQFTKGLMMNNADTGVIVTTEQQPDEAQREAILAALKERKRKAGTADRPLFLWGGAKVDKPTLSSADMQLLEGRKFSRQEICSIFKVPQELLGFTEDANRSVGDAARLNFIENRIAPLCSRLEAAVEPVVQILDPKVRGEFYVKGTPVMQAAQRARVDTATKAFALGATFNDCNRIYDLGFPAYPWGDKSFLPFSLQEVGAEETPKNNPQDPKEEKAADPFENLRKLFSSPILYGKGSPGVSPQAKTPAEEYAASVAGSERNKGKKLSKYFFEQRSRVLASLEKETKKSIETRSVDDLFNPEFENAELIKRMRPMLISDLEFGGAQVFREIGISDFKLPPSATIEYLDKREPHIEGINSTLWNEELKPSLQDGLKAGETFDQLADRVKSVYGDYTGEGPDTMRIAVTETNIAVNSGRMEGMTQAGVEKKAWISSHLENTRPAHVQAEKDYSAGISITEPFIVGGEALDHPCDPNGSPGNVINCRCLLIAKQGEKALIPTRFLKWEEFLLSKQQTGGRTNA